MATGSSRCTLSSHCEDAGFDFLYDLSLRMIVKTNRCNEPSRMRDVAIFIDSDPTLGISHEFVEGYTAGASQESQARDADEEDDGTQKLVAPFHPLKNMANWQLCMDDPTSCQLLVIKRATVTESLAVELEFTFPKAAHSLKLR